MTFIKKKVFTPALLVQLEPRDLFQLPRPLPPPPLALHPPDLPRHPAPFPLAPPPRQLPPPPRQPWNIFSNDKIVLRVLKYRYLSKEEYSTNLLDHITKIFEEFLIFFEDNVYFKLLQIHSF